MRLRFGVCGARRAPAVAAAEVAIEAVACKGISWVNGYPVDLHVPFVGMGGDGIAVPGHFADAEPERFQAGVERLRAMK